MSIGNLKDSGGKGTNYPFQLKVLQLLGQIVTMVSGGTPSLYCDIIATAGQTVFIPPNFSLAVGEVPLVLVNGIAQPNGWTVPILDALTFSPDPLFAGGEHIVIIK